MSFGIPFTMEVCPIDVRETNEAAAFSQGWNSALRTMRHEFAPLIPVNVIFHDPATIVYWNDGTKTVVKCQPGDTFNHETGLMAAMLKRYMGNDNTYNKVMNQWLPAPQLQLPEHTE